MPKFKTRAPRFKKRPRRRLSFGARPTDQKTLTGAQLQGAAVWPYSPQDGQSGRGAW